ncbi:hypothetical protein CYMTET_22629 [Cymbomonas tetramitiformis]|uniref:Uncharacterized protein n=1 Tax=Cymbomonas tetramitiformis TaxID=36881 RepID=A0AAE0L206_9CHLO|nr:hypothetical protein CYMTET_22629 [Cymbomonas tetramitiformis]
MANSKPTQLSLPPTSSSAKLPPHIELLCTLPRRAPLELLEQQPQPDFQVSHEKGEDEDEDEDEDDLPQSSPLMPKHRSIFKNNVSSKSMEPLPRFSSQVSTGTGQMIDGEAHVPGRLGSSGLEPFGHPRDHRLSQSMPTMMLQTLMPTIGTAHVHAQSESRFENPLSTTGAQPTGSSEPVPEVSRHVSRENPEIMSIHGSSAFGSFVPALVKEKSVQLHEKYRKYVSGALPPLRRHPPDRGQREAAGTFRSWAGEVGMCRGRL